MMPIDSDEIFKSDACAINDRNIKKALMAAMVKARITTLDHEKSAVKAKKLWGRTVVCALGKHTEAVLN
jgi:hypothetical protein